MPSSFLPFILILARCIAGSKVTFQEVSSCKGEAEKSPEYCNAIVIQLLGVVYLALTPGRADAPSAVRVAARRRLSGLPYRVGGSYARLRCGGGREMPTI